MLAKKRGYIWRMYDLCWRKKKKEKEGIYIAYLWHVLAKKSRTCVVYLWPVLAKERGYIWRMYDLCWRRIKKRKEKKGGYTLRIYGMFWLRKVEHAWCIYGLCWRRKGDIYGVCMTYAGEELKKEKKKRGDIHGVFMTCAGEEKGEMRGV